MCVCVCACECVCVCVWFSLVSLFNDISTLISYLILKLSLLKNKTSTIQPIAGEGKRVHTFPKSITPKMNTIMRLEFKLTYFDVIVEHINHYTKGSSHIHINHHQVTLISQILSQHLSLSSISPGGSSRLHPLSVQSCCK